MMLQITFLEVEKTSFIEVQLLTFIEVKEATP